MKKALEEIALINMGERSLFAGEYALQVEGIAKAALAGVRQVRAGELLGLCSRCEADGRCMKKNADAKVVNPSQRRRGRWSRPAKKPASPRQQRSRKEVQAPWSVKP